MIDWRATRHLVPKNIRKYIRRHITDHIPYGFGNPQKTLAMLFRRGGVGAEIGVWKGDYSKILLEKTAPRKLYLVDPWAFQPEFPDNGYGGSPRPFRGVLITSQADMDAMHDSVKKSMESHPEVTILRVMSSDMDHHIKEGELDWIYIDGNHAYEYALADLRMAWKLVKPGGQIAGDDFNFKNESSYYGVRTALLEFCNEKDVSIELIGNSQFLFERR